MTLPNDVMSILVEIRAEGKATNINIQALAELVRTHGNRISKLEDVMRANKLLEADAAGYARGASTAVVTRKQLIALGSLATFTAGMVEVIVRLIP